MDFVLRQTRDADDFVAGACALESFELGLREIKQVGEEREAGGVGRALHRRRGQPDLESLTDPARNCIARGAGLDTDGQGGLRLSGRLTGHRRYS